MNGLSGTKELVHWTGSRRLDAYIWFRTCRSELEQTMSHILRLDLELSCPETVMLRTAS